VHESAIVQVYRAMPIATAVVGDNRVPAFVVVALRDVAAERRSPAAARHFRQVLKGKRTRGAWHPKA
jgi:hypothetical protein